MRELRESEVQALAESAGLPIPHEDLLALVVRLNGLIAMSQKLQSLLLDGVEPIPTLPTQRDI